MLGAVRNIFLPAIALCVAGCVSRTDVWVDDTDNAPVRWHDVGGVPAATIAASGGSATFVYWDQQPVALALDSAGYPTVAFDDGALVATVGVRRWSGTHWEDLGSPGTGQGQVTLAVDAQDRPWVAWSGDDSPASVRVAMWDETAWQQLASISTGGALPGAEYVLPTLAFDPQERAVIAFGADGFGDFLCVHRHESGAWVLLEAPTTPCFSSDRQRPGLAVNSAGSLLLAYISRGQVWFSEWSSDAWSTQPVDSTTTADDRSPAVTGTVDGPVVAWVRLAATTSASAVLVRQQVGSNWIERSGSATDGGLGTAALFAAVALTTSPDGKPVAAWSDSTTLRLRYWTGSVWDEVFGSATIGIYSGGVSGHIVGTQPAIAVRGREVCVAFAVGSAAELDVHVRCATPAW